MSPGMKATPRPGAYPGVPLKETSTPLGILESCRFGGLGDREAANRQQTFGLLYSRRVDRHQDGNPKGRPKAATEMVRTDS